MFSKSFLKADWGSREPSLANKIIIPSALNRADACSLIKSIEKEVPWSVVFVNDGRRWELPADERLRIGSDVEQQYRDKAFSESSNNFSFYYETNPRGSEVQRSYEKINCAGLSKFLEYINSNTGLRHLRQLTGCSLIDRADGQATKYAAGSFLSMHDDQAGSTRKFAYVLNLTENWNATWGGLLLFHSPGGEIVESVVPEFNTLVVFEVPQFHSVSLVSSEAPKSRYAVSGWLHTS